MSFTSFLLAGTACAVTFVFSFQTVYTLSFPRGQQLPEMIILFLIKNNFSHMVFNFALQF